MTAFFSLLSISERVADFTGSLPDLLSMLPDRTDCDFARLVKTNARPKSNIFFKETDGILIFISTFRFEAKGLNCGLKIVVFMEYKKLVAVTGLNGLFELISSKADGGLVRSLEDKTTKFVSNRSHSFSHLESIEVYTNGENVNLVDVFNAMKASAEKMPDANDAAATKAYFQKVFPSMDFQRVYASDMKKMVKWLDILNKNGIEIKLSEGHSDDMIPETSNEKKASAAAAPKPAAVKGGPAKKINTPRKMA